MEFSIQADLITLQAPRLLEAQESSHPMPKQPQPKWFKSKEKLDEERSKRTYRSDGQASKGQSAGRTNALDGHHP